MAEEDRKLATELRFREDEKKLLVDGKLKTTIRLGDRTANTRDTKRGYQRGKSVVLTVQLPNGDFDQWQTRAVITDIELKRFGDLTLQDIQESNWSNSETLAKRLGELYGSAIGEGAMVSVVRFEYANRLKSVADLERAGVLRVAQRPPDNESDYGQYQSYVVPLIGADYPARTAKMWKAVFHTLALPITTSMMVGDPEQAELVLEVLRRDPRYLGGGMGVGFKDQVIPYLDELDPLAEAIDAVNFVLKIEDGKLKGFNTDGLGYVTGLTQALTKNGKKLEGSKVVVLGAGGASNAVAFQLACAGARVVILNRTVEKAEDLATRINRYLRQHTRGILPLHRKLWHRLVDSISDPEESVRFGGENEIEAEVVDSDVVVNVSSKGEAGPMQEFNALAAAELPANEMHVRANRKRALRALKSVPKDALISDIVLTSDRPTPLLRAAQRLGYRTQSGIPMVVHQGVEAFLLLQPQLSSGLSKAEITDIMVRAARI